MNGQQADNLNVALIFRRIYSLCHSEIMQEKEELNSS